MTDNRSLRALVVDDEPPAVDELRFLLEHDDRIASVACARSVSEARAHLDAGSFDVLFLDIEMPDATGLDLARELGEHTSRPAVVFVTAFERHAVEAFEVNAVDYLLKPVRADRLAQTVRRIAADRPTSDDASLGPRIAVESGGRVVFVERSSVTVVEASRDYVRLHTADRSYLIRTPIGAIEQAWSEAGFVRVHRSFIVAVRAISELRSEDGGTSVVIGAMEIPVSRTYARDLKQRLLSAGGDR
jgi:two-component system, LytTR family, response regulator LytT